ncbi:MAG: hypothetical protein IH946_04225, partial [Bacteroidetes bacterium]|nr:hypothetical protein [Bacteroidota bacterium]
MQRTTLRFYFMVVFLMPLFGCEIINPEEPVPAYLHIPLISLITDPAKEGSNSHKIIDAWVFVDDKARGVYELPVTIPLLYKGSPKITINAGIVDNGIADTRAIYSLYRSFVVNAGSGTIDLVPAQIDTLTPTVQYKDSAVFHLIEDFESMPILKRLKGDTGIVIGNDAIHRFEGNYGRIYLNWDKPIFEVVSIDSFQLPKQGTPVVEQVE